MTTSYSPSSPGSNCKATSGVCNLKIGTYCVDKTTPWSCNLSQPNCNNDPNCSLASEDCIEVVNGVCATAKQTYNCNKTEDSCNTYQVTNSCTNIAINTPSVRSDTDNTFNKAMKASSTTKLIKDNMGGIPVTIFPGKSMSCTENDMCKATQTCCCHRDAERHGNFLGLIKCSESEGELYAKNQKGLTIHLKTGCTDGYKDPLGSGCMYCSQKTSWYCAFDNKLAKTIQIQGRRQLASLATQGFSGATTSHKSFSFYDSSSHWFDLGTVNGNRVWVYRYNRSCNSDTPPASEHCPANLRLTFATCDNNNCSAPDKRPPIKQTDDRLTISILSPFDKGLSTLSRNVVIKGGCDNDANCNYDISAWKGSNVKTALQFYLQKTSGAGEWNDPVTIKGIELSPYTYGANETADKIKIKVSGVTSTVVQMDKNIPVTPITKVPGTNFHIFGKCDNGVCGFTLVTSGASYAKPFLVSQSRSGCSTSVSTDCSGFTVEELSLLDFSKIDLSFLTADLKPTQPDSAALTDKAKSDLARKPNQKNDQVVAWLDKNHCTGSCTVRLTTVPGWLPQNTLVKSVYILWGDGRHDTVNNGSINSNIIKSHAYSSVGDYKVGITFTLENGDKHYAELFVQVTDRYNPNKNGNLKTSLEATPQW